MLNIEELLIKIMQILDFDMNDIKLKQTAEKRRFYTNEESTEKYREHIELILRKLNIDTQNEKVTDIFIDLINLYLPIYNKLNLTKFIATEKKINWIILKRLVIPYLAKRFSTIDVNYDNRSDKGLSGGRFWYLPDITEYPKVKQPMEYVMNWWLDLYGRSLDSLCNEVDNYNPNEDENKSIESKNTIKQWLKKSIPSRKSIEEYCSIPLNYNGVFEVDKNNNIDVQFDKACEFVIKIKKLSIENLRYEIPYNSLVDKIFIDKKNVSNKEKKEFVRFITERWSKPTQKKLINSFIISRTSQSIYKGLLKYFSFKDSSDIEENKLLQLVYLYSFIYNENFQRELQQIEIFDIDDMTALNYEYLDSLNTSFVSIIETISNDINIELSNQNFSSDYLESIYQIKFLVYGQNSDSRLTIALEELKEHLIFFHNKFDNIEVDLNKYLLLSLKEKIDFIENSNDFTLLVNIYGREFLMNYELVEKCVFQMENLSKTDNDKIQLIYSFLQLYTYLSFEENTIKVDETKNLLDKYEKLVYSVEEKHMELLKFKIYFYIKSKQFSNALKSASEYYNKFIKMQKKNQDTIEILFLSAYVAYIQKDKSLKEFNKYLKKYTNKTFENSQSLPFKIFFYKK